MTDPTSMPFQDDERRPGEPQEEQETGASAPTPTGTGAEAPVPTGTDAGPDLLPPAETETDLLAARVAGPEDQEGMTALWRSTMALPSWWFIAVGEEGTESPAAAEIDDQLMLLTFTNAERARHFAVQNAMVGADEDMRAISLTPHEVVDSADVYRSADIAGLMFDPHLTGYFISTEQLPVVWDAIAATDEGTTPEG